MALRQRRRSLRESANTFRQSGLPSGFDEPQAPWFMAMSLDPLDRDPRTGAEDVQVLLPDLLRDDEALDDLALPGQ